MNGTSDKKLKTPKTDLKKKPSYDLLKCIGECSSQDITAHPFTKVKPPLELKIEKIFIKGGKKESKNKNKNESKNKKAKQLNKKNLKKKI